MPDAIKYIITCSIFIFASFLIGKTLEVESLDNRDKRQSLLVPPLTVELIGKDAMVYWLASNVSGKVNYTVQRSDDGVHFQNIAGFDGKATSNTTFSIKDRLVVKHKSQKLFYRIKYSYEYGKSFYSRVVPLGIR